MKASFHCRSSVPELDPFAGLTAVLGVAPIHVDPQRQNRKGVPEIVYAPGKAPRLTVAAARELLAGSATGRVLVSRADAEAVDLLRSELERDGASVLATPGGTVLLAREGASPPLET